MARDERGIIQQIFADTGDVADPIFDFAEGWPVAYAQSGGPNPEREVFNKLFQRLYALAHDVNRFGGGLPWDATIDYALPALVMGADNTIYTAVQASGPSEILGAVDPANDEENVCWVVAVPDLSAYLQSEDIGSSVQPYDAATAKTNVAQAWVPVQAYRPAILTSSDGVAIWNLIWQPVAELTMTEDVILTLSAASVGSTVILRVTQDATGGWSLIWPSTIKWMGGVVPDLTPAAGAIDMIQLDIGSNGTRYGQVVQDYKVAS